MGSSLSLDRFGDVPDEIVLAPGWSIRRAGQSARTLGANGLRFGPDGRLYVAQAVGSQVSAIDIADGRIETIVPVGGGISGPDDLAFDSHGTMFATEVLNGRVTARTANGHTRVVAPDMPAANGITIHHDRIFVDEFRSGGRLWEVAIDSSAPRLVAEGLPFPNALTMGEDGFLYFPVVIAGEIWRVNVAGGEPECVVGGLAAPVAVKFAPNGDLIAVNAGSGDVVRIDLARRSVTTIATTRPGLDNLAFGPDGCLFASHFSDGGISELLKGGGERAVVQPSMLGPWGVAVDRLGVAYVADGLSVASINRSGHVARFATMLGGDGWAGFARNVAIGADGAILIANSSGVLSRFDPIRRQSEALASGFGDIMGLASLPEGSVLVCDADNGAIVRVSERGSSEIARAIGRPMGVAVHVDGTLFASDAAGRRIVRLDQGAATTLAEGFSDPHGIALHGDRIYMVDRGDRSVYELALDGSSRCRIASDLPLGKRHLADVEHPEVPHPRRGLGAPFSGLAADSAGRLHVAADGDGSVLVLERIEAGLEGLQGRHSISKLA